MQKIDVEDIVSASAAKLALLTDLLCQMDYPNKPVKPNLSSKSLEGLYWFLSEIEEDLTRAYSTSTTLEV